MWDLISKRRKWRFLKQGRYEYGSQFSTISTRNQEKQAIDQIIYKSSINGNLVHSVKSVSFEFPDSLSQDDILTKSLEIPLNEVWTIYFFNEFDWAQVQLLR